MRLEDDNSLGLACIAVFPLLVDTVLGARRDNSFLFLFLCLFLLIAKRHYDDVRDVKLATIRALKSIWGKRETNWGFLLYCLWWIVSSPRAWAWIDEHDEMGEFAWRYPIRVLGISAYSICFFFWFDKDRPTRKENSVGLYKIEGSTVYADLTLPLVKPAIVFCCQVIFFAMYAIHINQEFREHRDPDTFWVLGILNSTGINLTTWGINSENERMIHHSTLFVSGAVLQFALKAAKGEHATEILDRIEYWFAVGDFIRKGEQSKSGSSREDEDEISHASVYARAFMGLIVNVVIRVSIAFLLPFQLSMSDNANDFITDVLGAYFILEYDEIILVESTARNSNRRFSTLKFRKDTGEGYIEDEINAGIKDIMVQRRITDYFTPLGR